MDHTDEYQLALLFETVAALVGFGRFREAEAVARHAMALLNDVLEEKKTRP